MRTRVLIGVVLLGLATASMVSATRVTAQESPPIDAGDRSRVVNPRLEEAVERLTDIRQSLTDKRLELDELQRRLKNTRDEEQRKDLQAAAEELRKTLDRLEDSFERIVIGGVDLTVFAEQPAQAFDWQNELIQITRPILNSLKEITEKPRKIEELRAEIELGENQLAAIDKALASIATFQGQAHPSALAEKLKTIAAQWRQRRADAEQTLEIAHFQLASLQGENVSSLQTLHAAFMDFLRGRGLTLLLAGLAVVSVWLVMRVGLWLYQKSSRPSGKQRITRARLAKYGFRLTTGCLTILAVLIVFYVRSDLLLMVLAILALVILAVGLRTTLPRYLAEARLLLDVGPVRVGERVVYNGLPLQVKSINMYSVLRNPDLEGVIRLPLATLDDMVSRPCGEEPWFPCRPGEYVLLPDARLGQVLRQTLEFVQLKVLGSLVQYPTADLLKINLRNLSREGFSAAYTFGLDYRHQAICLDQVPQRLQRALVAAFAKAGLAEQVVDILVDFKEAGANSLDYLINLNLLGQAASAYFKIGRLVQQTCVDVCNREGWVIPFGQLTIHQGEGFAALRSTQVQTGAIT